MLFMNVWIHRGYVNIYIIMVWKTQFARWDEYMNKFAWFECEDELPTEESPSEAQGQEATDNEQWAD